MFAPAAPAAPASDSAWTTIIIILACLRAGLLNGMLVAPSWAIVLEWKLAIDIIRNNFIWRCLSPIPALMQRWPAPRCPRE